MFAQFELRNRKEAKRKREVEEVIGKIRVNHKAFYTYARRKTVIRTKIGPLVVKGQTSMRESALSLGGK